MKDYTFDVLMNVTVRVPDVDSENQARDLLDANLYDVLVGLGAWPDGSPILGTANMVDAPRLIEIDGEAV